MNKYLKNGILAAAVLISTASLGSATSADKVKELIEPLRSAAKDLSNMNCTLIPAGVTDLAVTNKISTQEKSGVLSRLKESLESLSDQTQTESIYDLVKARIENSTLNELNFGEASNMLKSIKTFKTNITSSIQQAANKIEIKLKEDQKTLEDETKRAAEQTKRAAEASSKVVDLTNLAGEKEALINNFNNLANLKLEDFYRFLNANKDEKPYQSSGDNTTVVGIFQRTVDDIQQKKYTRKVGEEPSAMELPVYASDEHLKTINLTSKSAPNQTLLLQGVIQGNVMQFAECALSFFQMYIMNKKLPPFEALFTLINSPLPDVALIKDFIKNLSDASIPFASWTTLSVTLGNKDAFFSTTATDDELVETFKSVSKAFIEKFKETMETYKDLFVPLDGLSFNTLQGFSKALFKTTQSILTDKLSAKKTLNLTVANDNLNIDLKLNALNDINGAAFLKIMQYLEYHSLENPSEAEQKKIAEQKLFFDFSIIRSAFISQITKSSNGLELPEAEKFLVFLTTSSALHQRIA